MVPDKKRVVHVIISSQQDKDIFVQTQSYKLMHELIPGNIGRQINYRDTYGKKNINEKK